MLDEKIENVSCSFESSNIAQHSNILFVGWFLCNVQKRKKKKGENVRRDEDFDLKNDQDQPEITRCVLYRVDTSVLESGHVE